jgi:hypothetical protein
MPKPSILEGFNVERDTVSPLIAGGIRSGTRIRNLLDDTAIALGGFVVRWEPIQDGTIWHLRAYLSRS